MSAAARIVEVTAADAELQAAFERLTPQLSSSAPPPTPAELAEIATSPATRLLVARTDDGAIAGALTLALFRIPTGLRAWIEDVIVDDGARGQGIGESLIREATRLAADAGARTIDLTSRPDREAANRLYERAGFERRDTNVYRLTLRR